MEKVQCKKAIKDNSENGRVEKEIW